MGFYLRVSIVCGIAMGFLCYIVLFAAPSSFPKQLLVPVQSGETGRDIAQTLKADHAIRFELLFRVLLRLYGADSHITAGTYYFSHSENAFTIAWRLRVGNFDIEPIKITVPEGTDVAQIDMLFQKNLPAFDSNAFLKLAQPQEGYIFPDTYFFYPGESVTDIMSAMRQNFDTHMSDPHVEQALASSSKPRSDVIIMASLLEKEAPDTTNRKIIAGILWKRLKMNMPLQVDAVFPYITGKQGSDITQADYSVDSPYNTYTHTGLPPGPINNPGLDAIMDALNPSTTPYLYYLSDKQGNFHYSGTYDGQLANEKKYQ